MKTVQIRYSDRVDVHQIGPIIFGKPTTIGRKIGEVRIVQGLMVGTFTEEIDLAERMEFRGTVAQEIPEWLKEQDWYMTGRPIYEGTAPAIDRYEAILNENCGMEAAHQLAEACRQKDQVILTLQTNMTTQAHAFVDEQRKRARLQLLAAKVVWCFDRNLRPDVKTIAGLRASLKLDG